MRKCVIALVGVLLLTVLPVRAERIKEAMHPTLVRTVLATGEHPCAVAEKSRTQERHHRDHD